MKKHPVLTALAVLIVLGLVVKFWYLVVAGLVAFAGVTWWRRRTAEQSAIAARADAQHQAFLAGDDFGLYGFDTKGEQL